MQIKEEEVPLEDIFYNAEVETIEEGEEGKEEEGKEGEEDLTHKFIEIDEEGSEEKVIEGQEQVEEDPVKTKKAKEEQSKKPSKAPEKKVEKPDISQDIDFGAYAQSLIDKGIWFAVTDEEGNELDITKLDLTPEKFQELSENQAEWKAESILREREEEFGGQYKELVSFMKNGGKIDDLLQNYEQQKDIESIDTDDMDDAENLLREHTTQINPKWTKDQVDDYIAFLKDKGEEKFKSLAKSTKDQLIESVREEREQIKAEQEARKQQVEASKAKFNKLLTEAIDTQDLPDREKKELKRFYFEHRNAVEGGKVSDYYLKVNKILSEPKEFAKFLRFIKDSEAFEEKKKVEKEVVKKTFNLIKEGKLAIKKDTQEPFKKDDDAESRKGEPKKPVTFKKLFG